MHKIGAMKCLIWLHHYYGIQDQMVMCTLTFSSHAITTYPHKFIVKAEIWNPSPDVAGDIPYVTEELASVSFICVNTDSFSTALLMSAVLRCCGQCCGGVCHGAATIPCRPDAVIRIPSRVTCKTHKCCGAQNTTGALFLRRRCSYCLATASALLQKSNQQ